MDADRLSRLAAWACCVGLFVFTLPMVCTTPQSGDGSEFVVLAMQGGVPHPPGFPLQAWLNRLVVLLPVSTPSMRLGLLCLLAHCSAFMLLAMTLLRLHCKGGAVLLGAACFALLPTTWLQAVQPEVFALAYCFMAANILVAVTASTQPAWRESRKAPWVVGLVAGLSLAQHPITLTSFAAVAVAVHRVGSRNVKRWMVMVGVMGAMVLAMYGSLPLLRTDSVYPDWGKLDSVRALIRHVLREEYGVFSLSAHEGELLYSGLGMLVDELVNSWNVLLLLLPLGVVGLMRSAHGRGVFMAILGSLLLALVFLWRTSVGDLSPLAEGVLERFLGTAVVPLALLVGYGLMVLTSWMRKRAWRVCATAVALMTLGLLSVRAVEIVNVSKDHAVDVYVRAVAQSMEEPGIALAANDVDVFHGYPLNQGTVWPVAPGLLSLPWYRLQVIPAQYPGIHPPQTWSDDSVTQLIRVLRDRGVPVYSGNVSWLLPAGGAPERRGVMFMLKQGEQEPFLRASLKSVVALCPLLRELGPLPPRGRPFSRAMYLPFQSSFAMAAEFLKTAGDGPGAAAAQSVADGLRDATDPSSWNRACDTLNP